MNDTNQKPTHVIACADAWLRDAGQPTYSDLLAKLERSMTTTHTQPAGCDLDTINAVERAATMFRDVTAFHPGHFQQLKNFSSNALKLAAAARAAQAPQGDTRQAAHTCTPADERVLFESAMADILKSEQGDFAMSRAHSKGNPYTFLATKWAYAGWQVRAAQGAGTAPVACAHSWHDFGQTPDSMNRSYCGKCKAMAITGAEEVPPAPVSTAAATTVSASGGDTSRNLAQRFRAIAEDWSSFTFSPVSKEELLAAADAMDATTSRAADGQQATTASASDEEWEYRVSAGAATGWSLWNPGRGDEFEKSYKVERRIRKVPSGPVRTWQARVMDMVEGDEATKQWYATTMTSLGFQAMMDEIADWRARAPSRAADGQQGEDATVIDYGTPADGQQGASRAVLDVSASGLLKLWQQAQATANDTMPAPFQFAKLLLARAPLPAQGAAQVEVEAARDAERFRFMMAVADREASEEFRAMQEASDWSEKTYGDIENDKRPGSIVFAEIIDRAIAALAAKRGGASNG